MLLLTFVYNLQHVLQTNTVVNTFSVEKSNILRCRAPALTPFTLSGGGGEGEELQLLMEDRAQINPNRLTQHTWDPMG